jgi:hypothetical protein
MAPRGKSKTAAKAKATTKAKTTTKKGSKKQGVETDPEFLEMLRTDIELHNDGTPFEDEAVEEIGKAVGAYVKVRPNGLSFFVCFLKKKFLFFFSFFFV